LDFQDIATSVVYRALALSIRSLEARHPEWLQESLGTLFPDRQQLIDFIFRVSIDAQEARFELSRKHMGQRFSPPDLIIGIGGEEFLAVKKLIEIVEGYLREYKLPVSPPVIFPAPKPDSYTHERAPAAAPPPPAPAPAAPMESTGIHATGLFGQSDRGEGNSREKMVTTTKDITLDPNTSRIRVFYATDRMQLRTWNGNLRYVKGRSLLGNLHYGECEISVPKTHKLGKLETPSILKLEFSPDPAKHIVLQKIQSLEEGVFLERVAASVAASAAKEAFVFIHGYKVSFDDAARRTAQIGFDLHFVGAPIFYSWPSNGRFAAYIKDETNIAWSTPHFQRFLSLVSQHSGAKRIHIIAHSMGNRAVCEALKELGADSGNNLKFNHLVLAAPDIDADTFRELAVKLQKVSGRITLYESSKDKAIQASKKIHGNPRAGEPLLIIPGLDTIDASAIDTDFLGHSYFSDNWPLLSDIHSILFKDEPPAERFGLTEMQHPDGKYYAFRS
jgi:esterase/lipase superfamily enzyme